MQGETFERSGHKVWGWKCNGNYNSKSTIWTQYLWCCTESKVRRNFEVTWVQIIRGRLWCPDEMGLQSKWRPLLQVHVMIHLWIVTHVFQSKRRHGCFKYDLLVKGGIWPTWPVPRCQRWGGKIRGRTRFLVHQLCWLSK